MKYLLIIRRHYYQEEMSSFYNHSFTKTNWLEIQKCQAPWSGGSVRCQERGSDLRVIEVRQALCSEAFGQLTLDDDILHLVAQQLVVDVA